MGGGSDWISGEECNGCSILKKVISLLGIIPFHKENEWACDGNSRQNFPQLIYQSSWACL